MIVMAVVQVSRAWWRRRSTVEPPIVASRQHGTPPTLS
jgi:hypothetical protein